MSISVVQQAEVARLLGYPNLSPMSSLQLDYPYFSSQLALWQPYAMLVNRLAQAAPYDEVQYFGAESLLFGGFFTASQAQITFSTPSSITVGTIAQLNVGGTVLPYTTQSGDTPTSVAEQFAVTIMEDANINSNFMATATSGVLTIMNITALGADGNGIQCVFMSNSTTLLATWGGTQVAAQLVVGATAGGSAPPGPQFTPIGSNEPVFGYVPIIRLLESDLINARVNLDTLKADVWEPRQDELSVRSALYREYRKELADRLSVPLDPDLIGNAAGRRYRVV